MNPMFPASLVFVRNVQAMVCGASDEYIAGGGQLVKDGSVQVEEDCFDTGRMI